MPCSRGDMLIMALEAIELCVSFTDIEYFELVVSTSGQEPVSIDWVPADNIHLIVVGLDLIHSFALHPGIKHFDIVVFTTSQD